MVVLRAQADRVRTCHIFFKHTLANTATICKKKKLKGNQVLLSFECKPCIPCSRVAREKCKKKNPTPTPCPTTHTLPRKVERTRGEAFEAGSAPIPGFSEIRRRRKRFRENKGRGQGNAAEGGEREQRFGSERPSDGGRRWRASSRVHLRSEGEAIDPVGNVAGSPVAAADVGVFSATEGARRSSSGESNCSGTADFAGNESSSENTQNYREPAVNSNTPNSGPITAGRERFKRVGAGEEDNECGYGSGMAGGVQVRVTVEDIVVEDAGEGARRAKAVRQGEDNDGDPYNNELEDDDLASGLLSGELSFDINNGDGTS